MCIYSRAVSMGATEAMQNLHYIEIIVGTTIKFEILIIRLQTWNDFQSYEIKTITSKELFKKSVKKSSHVKVI